jgi:hypothetical protein
VSYASSNLPEEIMLERSLYVDIFSIVNVSMAGSSLESLRQVINAHYAMLRSL